MQSLFVSLIFMSCIASLLILAVLLMRMLLRKYPKKYSYILWIVPALRLICPIYITSPIAYLRAAFIINDSYSKNTISLPAKETILVLDFVFILWISVFIILVTKETISYFKFRTSLKNTSRIDSDVYVCSNIREPFTFGFFKKAIYIPDTLSEEEKKFVIYHERVHVRRFDNIVKLTGLIIRTMHWFNPLVWLGYKLMCIDMEMSCDEAVIKDTNRKQYAEVLLSLSTEKPVQRCSSGFSSGVVKKRISNILEKKKGTKKKIAVFTVVITFFSLVCLVTPISKSVHISTTRESSGEMHISISGVKNTISFHPVRINPVQIKYEDRYFSAKKLEDFREKVKTDEIVDNQIKDVNITLGY